MQFNLTVTIIVVIYLLAMLFIGWYSSTKITSNTDFMGIRSCCWYIREVRLDLPHLQSQ